MTGFRTMDEISAALTDEQRSEIRAEISNVLRPSPEDAVAFLDLVGAVGGRLSGYERQEIYTVITECLRERVLVQVGHRVRLSGTGAL